MSRRVVALLLVLGCGTPANPADTDDTSGGPSSSEGSTGASSSATATTAMTSSTTAGSTATSASTTASTTDGGSSSDGGADSSSGDEPPPPEAVAVAVGYGTRRVRSDDGVTWTDFVEVNPNGGDDNDLLRGIGYGDGVFVAVGGGGSGFSMRSNDGITWTDDNHTLDAFVSDCVWLDGTFVIAGGNGLLARSTDAAVTWQDDSPYFAGHYRAIAASDTLAVAVGHTYGDSMVGLINTTDGSGPWSGDAMVGAQYAGHGIAFGHGVFVTHDSDGVLRWSDDGLQWNQALDLQDGAGWVAFANAQFITAGDGSYWVSTDGASWDALASDNLRDVVGFIDGHFMTLGWPAAIDISDDLATWQNVFAPGGSGLTDIAVGVPG